MWTGTKRAVSLVAGTSAARNAGISRPLTMGVPLLILLLSWFSFRAVNSGAETFDRALAELDYFSAREAALQRDVLAARAGLLRNYDPLVREANDLAASVARLRALAGDRATTTAVERLSSSLDRQESLLERLKSNNALLQNSLASFRLLSRALGAPHGDPALAAVVGALGAATLRLTLDTAPTAADEVRRRIADLSDLKSSANDASSVRVLIAHAQLLQQLLPSTDEILRLLSSDLILRERDRIRELLTERQAASRAMARHFRVLLYVTSLGLVALLTQMGLQLHARARELLRRAALEHVIAANSMSFVDATAPDIEAVVTRALAAMARCVGGDRAYLLLERPARTYTWCREGSPFPEGGPQRAQVLAGRLASSLDGVVYIADAHRLSEGAAREACAELGIRGWACVRDRNGCRSALLGFDYIGRTCSITPRGELGLLRTALDGFVHAIERRRIEAETGALEARLQRAQRMETVGALASGVAHSFNNIITAILGFAETASAQSAAGGSVPHGLAEIQRVAEGARELIDQIMAFGRRRDLRGDPVNLAAQVATAASLLRASLPPDVELILGEIAPAAVVRTESVQLQQVLLNLCHNAAQAIQGRGRIHVSAGVQDFAQTVTFTHGHVPRGLHVCIAVSDTGRGIDESVLSRIFEPFFTTRPDGNGLGLATVSEIVRGAGGAMNVISTVNSGSRFEAWLPCTIQPQEDSQEDSQDDLTALPLGGGETVLIVDGNREQMLRGEEILAALGYEPVGFTQAGDVLDACRNSPQRFDAAIVGRLPSIQQSVDLSAMLRDLLPGRPAILATAGAESLSPESLVLAGVSELVARPLLAPEIALALKRGLSFARHPSGASRPRGTGAMGAP